VSLKEYFLLSNAQAAAKLVPEGARKAIATLLGVARRRAEAAERLWSNGHTAEGLRLAVDAFGATQEALPAFVEATGAPVDAAFEGDGLGKYRPVLLDRGLTERRVNTLLEVEKLLVDREAPVLDEDVRAADGELFQKIIATRSRLDAALSPAASSPSQLAWTRIWRLTFSVLTIVAIAATAYLVTRTPEGITAVASDYTNVFDGPRVIDGDPETEWQLPGGSLGYVEISIQPPVHMEQLRLLNGHNRWYNDRATRAYRVELYSADTVVETVDGEFAALEPEPEWTEHALEEDTAGQEIDRIRFSVRSFHRLGAGLAEIEWH